MSIEFQDNREEFLSKVDEGIAEFLYKVGAAAEKYAKDKCPVGTPESTGIPNYVGGTLKGSITHSEDKRSTIIGSDVEYCPYVECGTYKMVERPFLRPAITDHGKVYAAMWRNAMSKIG